MLRIGIVGFGFMGRTHYRCWKAIADAKVTAICDSNPNLVDDARKAVGNIGDADEAVDFDNLTVYRDFDEMIAHAQLDAVSITLPTYLHKAFTIKALDAGLHVLCEKPMALNSDEGALMMAAADRNRKRLQIGHCIRFWPEYVKTKAIIDSGKYGRVQAASFRRFAAAPTWSDDNWLVDERRSGGVGLDLHIHDTDYVQHLFGMPKAVSSDCARSRDGQLLHLSTHYRYGNDMVITAEGGWAMMPAFGFEMSFVIVLEKATLIYDCTRDPVFKLCPSSGDAFTPPVSEGDGWTNQVSHFARAIAREDVPDVLTPLQSCNSLKIIEAEIESVNSDLPVAMEGRWTDEMRNVGDRAL